MLAGGSEQKGTATMAGVWQLLTLLTLLALGAVPSFAADPTDVPIKIVRAKATPRANSASTLLEPSPPVGSRAPAPFTGPSRYTSLLGSCFGTTAKGYFYQLCPFQNVTQKDMATSSRNRFFGLLG